MTKGSMDPTDFFGAMLVKAFERAFPGTNKPRKPSDDPGPTGGEQPAGPGGTERPPGLTAEDEEEFNKALDEGLDELFGPQPQTQPGEKPFQRPSAEVIKETFGDVSKAADEAAGALVEMFGREKGEPRS